MMDSKRLGIGFVGSGFITGFHIRSMLGVRRADVLGIWSPNAENASRAASQARELRVGEARPYGSISDMIADRSIDCLWICGPNHARVDNLTEIVEAIESGVGELVGVACEKPLGRTVAEAIEMRALVRRCGLLDGYLENQVFAPSVVRGRELVWTRGAAVAGRPYLARAAEEHSGPHAPWFWSGELQGGGVLNDMMCHSVELGRFLLTEPGRPRSSLTARRISGQMACLKWQRPRYREHLSRLSGGTLDYGSRPSEDFARAYIEYEDEQGTPLAVEATTSWCYVGAGLRLSAEVLGPEYSMSMNSLRTDLSIFLSRDLQQTSGEDLVEKQNAETGLMPVLADEPAAYGYVDENRHMVESFLAGRRPRENFDDGVEVTELLMAAYMSAEEGKTLSFPPPGLQTYVPAPASGNWDPRTGGD